MFDLRVPSPLSHPATQVRTDVGELVLPADDQVLLPYMQRAGTWEPSEGELLRSLLTPRTRFLDVGANVGYFSIFASKACYEGSVDAVEPDPRNFEFLKMNLWVNGAHHVKSWPVALGDRRGLVRLLFDKGNSGNTRVTHALGASAHVAALITADELFDGRLFDVVKIDVQGFEADVVLGMRRMICRAKHLAMVVEFFPRAIVERDAKPAEVLRTYRELGLDRVVSVAGRLARMEDDEILTVCAEAGRDGFVNLLLKKP